MVQAPRGIVFDLDGTLIDSGGDIVAAINYALVATGRRELPAATLRRFVGDGARLLCARAVGLPEKSPEVDVVLATYLAYYSEHPVVFTRWMPHARAVLDQLSHHRLAICTNKPRTTADLVLARLGVGSLFSAVIGGGDVAAVKPSPLPVLEIAQRLQLDPSQLVMVGDGPQDVEAGRRAGCRTIGIQGGFLAPERLIAAQPDVLIESLAELPDIVARWNDATVKAR